MRDVGCIASATVFGQPAVESCVRGVSSARLLMLESLKLSLGRWMRALIHLPSDNLRDSNISNRADETPRTQLSTAGCPKTVADAIHPTSRIYVRSLTVCYHTSTTKKTPRTHTIWVSDTTAPKQTKTASIIISEVIVQATGTDTPHHTLLAYVSPTSERFGYTHSATKRLVMTFTSATFYLPS